METLFQIIVVFLILLLLSFVTPKLKSLIYTAVFLFIVLYTFKQILIPFSASFIRLFTVLPNSFVAQLIASSILFFISDLIATHMEDAGYSSLGKIAHFSIKISIITLWMNDIKDAIHLLSTIIKF